MAEQALFLELKTLFGLSAVDERVARQFLRQFLPQVSDLSKRFNESVTVIASYNQK